MIKSSSKLLLLVLLLRSVTGLKLCDNLAKEKFVPKYVEEITPQCSVTFGGKVSAQCGNELSFATANTIPTIGFEGLDDGGDICPNATIISIDPDSIGIPPYLHILASNIPAGCVKKGYNSKTSHVGDIQAPYVNPGGPGHRYLFCVYCQQNYIEPRQYDLVDDRMGFNMREYARTYNLAVKACNYFKLVPAPK